MVYIEGRVETFLQDEVYVGHDGLYVLVNEVRVPVVLVDVFDTRGEA